MFKRKTASNNKGNKSPLKLGNGSQVALIGGGPAGSFFSYFLLDMADKTRDSANTVRHGA